MNLKNWKARFYDIMSPVSLRAQVRRRKGKIDSHGARAVYLGGRRVLLKAVVFGRNIAFILESDDRLLAPWFIVSGQYETAITNWVVPRLRPDSVCIDVGANFGYFTCLFGRFCPNGKVIGVEPDPTVFQILRDNVLINGFSAHASALNKAVAADSRPLTLYRRNTRSGNTSIIKASDDFTASLGEKPVESFVVDTVTVDRLCEDLGGRVDFLKIDVEGAEPLVIEGAASAIERNPNINIVMEWSPGQISGAGFDLATFVGNLKRHGLVAYALSEAGQESRLDWDALLASPYMAGVILRRV